MSKQVASRAQRRQQFLRQAGEMYGALEDWHAGHPQATFGEIKQQVRMRRGELMGGDARNPDQSTRAWGGTQRGCVRHVGIQ